MRGSSRGSRSARTRSVPHSTRTSTSASATPGSSKTSPPLPRSTPRRSRRDGCRHAGARAPQDRHRTPPQRHPTRGVGVRGRARPRARGRGPGARRRRLEPHRRSQRRRGRRRPRASSTTPWPPRSTRASRSRCGTSVRVRRRSRVPEFRYDLVRVGAFCYGIRSAGGPDESGLGIRPIASLVAPVTHVGEHGVTLGVGSLHGLPSTLAEARPDRGSPRTRRDRSRSRGAHGDRTRIASATSATT